jgi:hypothetical protein
MGGVFLNHPFYFFQIYFLQNDVRYFKEDDPMAAAVLLIGFGVVIGVSLVVNLARRGIGPTGLSPGRGGQGPNTRRRFSGMALRRIAGTYGFNREQTKLLDTMFRTEGVTDPERVMQNIPSLDRYFKQAYKRIEESAPSEEKAQEQLFLLFSMRNAVESFQGGDSAEPRVSANMAAVFTIGNDPYPVRVVSVKGNQIHIECPRSPLGTPIKPLKGIRGALAFFTKSSGGFTYDVQVIGIIDSPKGPVVQLVHTGHAKSLAQRRFKRREVNMPCVFHLVIVAEDRGGRKKQRRMTVDKRRFTGTIIDIAVGGCAIRTASDIAPGSRLKIEINYGRGVSFAVLGQVLRLNRGGSDMIMHTKFLKVPRRALNAISATVFEYDNYQLTGA